MLIVQGLATPIQNTAVGIILTSPYTIFEEQGNNLYLTTGQTSSTSSCQKGTRRFSVCYLILLSRVFCYSASRGSWLTTGLDARFYFLPAFWGGMDRRQYL